MGTEMGDRFRKTIEDATQANAGKRPVRFLGMRGQDLFAFFKGKQTDQSWEARVNRGQKPCQALPDEPDTDQ